MLKLTIDGSSKEFTVTSQGGTKHNYFFCCFKSNLAGQVVTSPWIYRLGNWGSDKPCPVAMTLWLVDWVGVNTTQISWHLVQSSFQPWHLRLLTGWEAHIWPCLTPLVRMQIDTAIMESSMDLPQEKKHGSNVWSSHSGSKWISNRCKGTTCSDLSLRCSKYPRDGTDHTER